MPRYNIQHPETKLWSCFSTIVDDFVCDWMTEENYIEWLLKEEREKIIHNLNLLKDRNYFTRGMTYEECLQTIEWRKHCRTMSPDDDGSTIVEDYKRIFNGGSKK